MDCQRGRSEVFGSDTPGENRWTTKKSHEKKDHGPVLLGGSKAITGRKTAKTAYFKLKRGGEILNGPARRTRGGNQRHGKRKGEARKKMKKKRVCEECGKSGASPGGGKTKPVTQ